MREFFIAEFDKKTSILMPCLAIISCNYRKFLSLCTCIDQLSEPMITVVICHKKLNF